jgi:hypothetical protein
MRLVLSIVLLWPPLSARMPCPVFYSCYAFFRIKPCEKKPESYLTECDNYDVKTINTKKDKRSINHL